MGIGNWAIANVQIPDDQSQSFFQKMFVDKAYRSICLAALNVERLIHHKSFVFVHEDQKSKNDL